MKHSRYVYVGGRNWQELADSVNRFAVDGWLPIGPVSYIPVVFVSEPPGTPARAWRGDGTGELSQLMELTIERTLSPAGG